MIVIYVGTDGDMYSGWTSTSASGNTTLAASDWPNGTLAELEDIVGLLYNKVFKDTERWQLRPKQEIFVPVTTRKYRKLPVIYVTPIRKLMRHCPNQCSMHYKKRIKN